MVKDLLVEADPVWLINGYNDGWIAVLDDKRLGKDATTKGRDEAPMPTPDGVLVAVSLRAPALASVPIPAHTPAPIVVPVPAPIRATQPMPHLACKMHNHHRRWACNP